MYHGDGVTVGGRTFTKKELNASSVKEANAMLKARGKDPITASRWNKLKTLHKQKSDERQEKKKKKQTKAKAPAQTKAKGSGKKSKAKSSGKAKRNGAGQQMTMSF